MLPRSPPPPQGTSYPRYPTAFGGGWHFPLGISSTPSCSAAPLRFSVALEQSKPNGNVSSEPQNGTPSWNLLSSLKPSVEGPRPTICHTGYRSCQRGGKGLMGRGDNRDRVHCFPLTGSDTNRGSTDLYKREAGSPSTAAPSPHPPTSQGNLLGQSIKSAKEIFFGVLAKSGAMSISATSQNFGKFLVWCQRLITRDLFCQITWTGLGKKPYLIVASDAS